MVEGKEEESGKGSRELEVGLADERGRVTLQEASRVSGLQGHGKATGERGQELGRGCVAVVTRWIGVNAWSGGQGWRATWGMLADRDTSQGQG